MESAQRGKIPYLKPLAAAAALFVLYLLLGFFAVPPLVKSMVSGFAGETLQRKASFGEDQLLANARAFVDAIQRAKPTGAKGTYVKKVAVSSTMGPGVKVDVASLAAGA